MSAIEAAGDHGWTCRFHSIYGEFGDLSIFVNRFWSINAEMK